MFSAGTHHIPVGITIALNVHSFDPTLGLLSQAGEDSILDLMIQRLVS